MQREIQMRIKAQRTDWTASELTQWNTRCLHFVIIVMEGWYVTRQITSPSIWWVWGGVELTNNSPSPDRGLSTPVLAGIVRLNYSFGYLGLRSRRRFMINSPTFISVGRNLSAVVLTVSISVFFFDTLFLV